MILTMPEDAVVAHMQALISQWEAASDQRSIFLSCYLLMTQNMRLAISQGEFIDPAWVDRLVDHFAGYYFTALDAYERDPSLAPPVWQLAHRLAAEPDVLALRKLLLGVNAHINYDLVLSVVDLLAPDWTSLSADRRDERYLDYCHVNQIIGCTIDAVQDQVLEPAMPGLDLIDRLLGSLDERLISSLLTAWRENVWGYALQLLDATDPQQKQQVLQAVEGDALKIGELIG
jgi:hypothetical protein